MNNYREVNDEVIKEGGIDRENYIFIMFIKSNLLSVVIFVFFVYNKLRGEKCGYL